MEFAEKSVRVQDKYAKEKKLDREKEEKKKEDMIIKQVKDQLPTHLKFNDDQIP
jgi:hypothetical protein